MTTWIFLWWLGGVAHAGTGTKTCRWVTDELASAPDEHTVLGAIANDRDHVWDRATVDCLRDRSTRVPVILAARRRVLRDLAGGSAGPFDVDPGDAILTPTFDVAAILSKRIEIQGKGWTGKVLLHPTFVDESLPGWFHVPDLLALVSGQERPGSQVPAIDLADAYDANVSAHSPMREGGHLGNPAYVTKLADAPLSWAVGTQQRVVWLDLEAVDGGIAVSWSMNRLDLGPPYLPVNEPERILFRGAAPSVAAFDAHAPITPALTSSTHLVGKWPAARVATVTTGFAVLAGGVAAVLGTYFAYDPDLDLGTTIAPSNQALVRANTASTAVAAVGGVAAVVGLALPARLWHPKRK